MSDYFYKSCERQVPSQLHEILRYSMEFEVCLNTDLDKVNGFYATTLQEFEERLRLLKESVAAIAQPRQQQRIDPETGGGDDEDYYLETPLLEKTKSKWTKMDALAIAIAKRLGVTIVASWNCVLAKVGMMMETKQQPTMNPRPWRWAMSTMMTTTKVPFLPGGGVKKVPMVPRMNRKNKRKVFAGARKPSPFNGPWWICTVAPSSCTILLL